MMEQISLKSVLIFLLVLRDLKQWILKHTPSNVWEMQMKRVKGVMIVIL